MQLADSVVVVTGGGNGIGREVVLQLLQRKARVAAVDLRQASLDDTAHAANAGDRLSTHVVDIADRAAVEALPRQVIDAHGAIDGVINVAGIIQPFVRLKDLDLGAIERVINVNLYGTIYIIQALLPHLLERPTAHIATVSSMGGYLPVPGQTIYGATKAGVKLMTEGLYAELLDTEVNVSVILPGAVATEITANSGLEAPVSDDATQRKYRTTSAQDAGKIILDGIAANKLHIFVGRDARLMNILTRIAPRRATRLIYRQMRDLLPQ